MSQKLESGTEVKRLFSASGLLLFPTELTSINSVLNINRFNDADDCIALRRNASLHQAGRLGLTAFESHKLIVIGW